MLGVSFRESQRCGDLREYITFEDFAHSVQVDSYLKLIDKLPRKRKIIYDIISRIGPCTSLEIKEWIGGDCEICSVSGRVTELYNLGLIEVSDPKSKINPKTGNENTLWRCKR